MNGKSKERQRGLTIYLIEASFDDKSIISKPAHEHQVLVDGVLVGTLYIESRQPKPPQWAEFFTPYVPPEAFGWVSTSSAVLLVETSGRTFAITFGHGRHLLALGCCEERFGLKVVLNSIPPERIRSLDKRSFDAINSNSRVQASQEANAQEFGIDAEQDLLRAVTGIPGDYRLGKRLSGRDALHADVLCSLQTIKELLSLYYSKFQDDTYKAEFAWIDNIAELPSESPTANALNNKLLDILQDIRVGSKNAKCWLSVPEIIDWERTESFQYGRRASASRHHDLHLPGFFRSVEPHVPITMALLRERYALAVDPEGSPVHKWQVYKCIHCEIEEGSRVYILSGGKWYAIARDLADQVNDYYANLPRFQTDLPVYDDEDEASYCRRVADGSAGAIALMDRKLVRLQGRTSPIEFCDLYTARKEMIHVKRYGASNVLNHLFAQGLVSGEALRSLEGFVAKVNEHLAPSHRLPDGPVPRDTAGRHIVFAIVSESRNELVLPFFARVSLRHAAKRLTSMGFDVSLAKVSVDDHLSRTEKVPPDEPRRRRRKG